MNENKHTIIFSSEFNDYLHKDSISDFTEKIIFGYKANIQDHDNYDIYKMFNDDEIFRDTTSVSKFNSYSINNFQSYTNIKWIIFPNISAFNENIVSFPSNLEVLTLGNAFTQSLEKLPKSLKYFVLQNHSYSKISVLAISSIIQPQLFNFENLKYFGIKTPHDSILNKLPKSTKYIELNLFRYGNNNVQNNKNLDLLPNNLNTLILSCNHKSELKNLPNIQII